MLLRSVLLGLSLLLLPTRNAIDQSASAASGELSGHVYAANSGAPLSNAIVTLDGNSRQHTRTAADGSYSFGSLAPGEYNIVAYKTGFLGAIYNLQRFAVISMRLAPGQKLDRVDFHLKPAPLVTEMNDDALTAAYSPKERLYLTFSSGQFSSDGARIGLVAGDILSGDPEQVWLYDLKSHGLIAVTDKPTPDKMPAIRDLAWAGETLYVDGLRRSGDRRFVVAASPGKIEEITAAPAQVERNFTQEEAMSFSGGVHVGRYVVTGVSLHGGDSQYSAREGINGSPFIIAAAIHGTPIFDSGSSTVFFNTGNGWDGKIVAFHLDTRRAQELEVPGGD
jgi:hypothetical protein